MENQERIVALQAEEIRRKRLKIAKESLDELVHSQYGLVKGQSVAKHTRYNPQTGTTFTAGQGGSGSPEAVLKEGRTVSAAGTVGRAHGTSGNSETMIPQDPSETMPEGSVYNPETLEKIIRNIHNATVEELMTMANQLFTQPRCRQRGIIAELMLTEILSRGLVEKGEVEKQMEGLQEEKADVESENKDKEMKAQKQQKEKEKSANVSQP
jgi:hypothetical protein